VTKYLLVIDVGNTHTTIGVFKEAELLNRWRISSQDDCTADELWLKIDFCLKSASIPAEELSGIGISSVVPALTGRYHEVGEQRLNLNPVVVSVTTVPNLRVDYNPPQAVGADRLCSAYAGYKKYGGPLIIIDLGTATVFDVVSEDGSYVGGLIAPGVNTAADSLHKMTAVLPRVDLQFPESVIGKSTTESIQSGILYGAIEMIDGVVGRIQACLPQTARVIATGGFSNLLQLQSKTIEIIEPDLVLDGIRMIVESQ
jgi:type III pantothenate kinase